MLGESSYLYIYGLNFVVTHTLIHDLTFLRKILRFIQCLDNLEWENKPYIVPNDVTV